MFALICNLIGKLINKIMCTCTKIQRTAPCVSCGIDHTYPDIVLDRGCKVHGGYICGLPDTLCQKCTDDGWYSTFGNGTRGVIRNKNTNEERPRLWQ